MNATWYYRRLRQMSAGEIAGRCAVAARQSWWSSPARRPVLTATLLPGGHRAAVALPRGPRPPSPAADAVVEEAEAMLRGEWRVFHLAVGPHPFPASQAPPANPACDGARVSVPSVDWFHDPLTGRRAPQDGYCFRSAATGTRPRSATSSSSGSCPATSPSPCSPRHGGSRATSGSPNGAARPPAVWWEQNPFLQGVHWVSGIEVGLRLLSWTWIRALLAEWGGRRQPVRRQSAASTSSSTAIAAT